MRVIFADVCNDFEAGLVEFDGERNHVHLLVNYPPKVSVSRMVNSLKGVSSRLLKKQHPETGEAYYGRQVILIDHVAAPQSLL